MKAVFPYITEEVRKKVHNHILYLTNTGVCSSTLVPTLGKKKHVQKTETVQRRATRWLPSFRDFSYEERLATLKLPTLEHRRKGGDMIMLHECVERKETIDVNDYLIPWLDGRIKNYIIKA